jgi:hypothetical protein
MRRWDIGDLNLSFVGLDVEDKQFLEGSQHWTLSMKQWVPEKFSKSGLPVHCDC